MTQPHPRRVAFFLITSLLFSSIFAVAQERPRVLNFSPSGLVKQVRQVRVRFSRDMVALGDPRPASNPFDIECPMPGRGLWVDNRNWVYDFEQDLPAGMVCHFRVAPNLRTLAGESLTGSRSFEFSTGGPAIIRSYPYEGHRAIEESQVFLLVLDAPPDRASVADNVYFNAEGIVEKIGFEFIDGELREQLMASQPYFISGVDPARVLLIQPRRHFPQSAGVSLVWGSGVASESGVPTGSDQVLPFAVRPEFTANFSCSRDNFDEGCIPFSQMQVGFSAPVRWDAVAASRLVTAEGREWTAERHDSAEEYVYSLFFEGPFPSETSFTLHLPAAVEDDAGRPLANQDRFPLDIRTDSYPPLAKFASEFGILEAREGGLLPVTLRNIEVDLELNQRKLEVAGRMRGRTYRADASQVSEIAGWLRRLKNRSWDDRATSIFSGVETNPAYFEDLQIPRGESTEAFQVLGIPLREKGFYVTEIESQLLGAALLDQKPTMYVPAAALVTDLGVHLKWGVESSLVWVTQLSDGKPVSGSLVQIWDCRSQLLGESRTDKDGIARFSSALPALNEAERCSWNAYDSGLFATARTRDDFSFVHSDWTEGIERWRFGVPTTWDSRLVSSHTVLDRTLFRGGETVHMKHFIRRQSGSGFERLPTNSRPEKLVIQHQGSGQSYEMNLAWDSNGTATSDWEISTGARNGTYSIRIEEEDGGAFYSGTFRVEDFRVPLMTSRLQGPSEKLINPQEIPLDVGISYFSGGGAGQLPISLRYRQEQRSLPSFEGYSGFQFGSGPIQEGVQRLGEGRAQQTPPEIKRLDTRLDNQGTSRVVLETSSSLDRPSQLRAEVEYQDPNGEIQTASTAIPIWSSSYLLGIKPDSWALSPETLKFQVAVLDLEGKPVSDVPVQVEAFENLTFSHRKRLVGGFYAYEHVNEIKKSGLVCEGQSNRRGLVLCESPTELSGSVYLMASTKDPAGRSSFTHQNIWVAGKDSWWFQAEDHDRVDLIPEQPRYEPGQKARLQVRMPFRQATVLISVEREGVLDTYVRRLTRNKPVIDIPVLENYAPNVFVSALIVRGRASGSPPTATVDLGKPAYKLGIAEIKVGWSGHELQVEAQTPRDVYQVREMVPVEFRVRAPRGQSLPADTELAVAAVDEGLLELQPNLSWELLQAMMGQRGLAVDTATAQMQVVGKRHFGLKALPAGGGGGNDSTRELFDTLLFWNARVPVDKQGKATLEIPLNDSLTSFRIVAVAAADSDLFGTGSTSIRTTQDLMLFSGIPPLVREGDRFSAIFTVRNTAERQVHVTVEGQVSPEVGTLATQELTLEASQARQVRWEVTAPLDVSELVFDVAVKSDNFSDRIRMTQQVVPAVPVRTFQATLSQISSDPLVIPVERPADAIPGRGGVEVVLKRSLTASLEGVWDYMRRYPYTCLEQKVSKAIALGDQALWERTMASLPAYLDTAGLAKYFPTSPLGSDVLTSYLLGIAAERGWQIPLPSLERMTDGLSGFVQGRVIRYSSLPTTDLTLRKLAALAVLSHYGRASASLVSVLSVQPQLWPTSALIDWLNLLGRVPDLPERSARLEEVQQQLRGRLTFRGTVMGFSSENRDRLWWLMVSADSNAVRLILALLEQQLWTEDLPRLMSGAIGRMRNGRWDLTTANAWGVLATQKFAGRFEGAQVSGETVASLSSTSQRHRWFEQPDGGKLHFDWPSQQEDLQIQQQGSGQPWAMVRSLAAVPLREPLSAGYTIRRTVEGVEKKRDDIWSVGDIVRIRLELEAQAEMTWVVVSDPIPAGASILGTGLGGDSVLARQGERSAGRAWPTFQERTFEGFRSYFQYVPKGSWTVEYTLRLNNPGTFSLPPTRVEAMYQPEVFGELPNQDVEVEP